MICFSLILLLFLILFTTYLVLVKKKKMSDLLKSKIYLKVITSILIIFLFFLGYYLIINKQNSNTNNKKLESINTDNNKEKKEELSNSLEKIYSKVKLINAEIDNYKKQEVSGNDKKYEFYLDNEGKIKFIVYYGEEGDTKFYYDKDKLIYVDEKSLNNYYFKEKELIQWVNKKEDKQYNKLNENDINLEEFSKSEKLQYEKGMKYYKSVENYLNFVKSLKVPEEMGKFTKPIDDISEEIPTFKFEDVTGDGAEENIIVTTTEEDSGGIYSYNVYIQDSNSGDILYKTTLNNFYDNKKLIGEIKGINLEVHNIDNNFNNVILVTIYTRGRVGTYGNFLIYIENNDMKVTEVSNMVNLEVKMTALDKKTACLEIPALCKKEYIDMEQELKERKFSLDDINLGLGSPSYGFEYDRDEKVSKLVSGHMLEIGYKQGQLGCITVYYKFDLKSKTWNIDNYKLSDVKLKDGSSVKIKEDSSNKNIKETSNNFTKKEIDKIILDIRKSFNDIHSNIKNYDMIKKEGYTMFKDGDDIKKIVDFLQDGTEESFYENGDLIFKYNQKNNVSSDRLYFYKGILVRWIEEDLKTGKRITYDVYDYKDDEEFKKRQNQYDGAMYRISP